MNKDNHPYPENTSVRKPLCTRCGKPIRLLPIKFMAEIYGEESDVKGLSRMCPKCRRKVIWEGCVSKI